MVDGEDDWEKDWTDEDKKNPLDYSRGLDVHRWSDYPEVNEFVNRIYVKHFQTRKGEIQKRHLKVVLLDLYVAWTQDPELKISYSRNSNDYLTRSIYNELHISRRTIAVIDDLEKHGFVEQKSGFFDRVSGHSRRSRVWPTKKLIGLFENAAFTPFDVCNSQDRVAVILRDKDPDAKAAKDIEYEPNEDTVAMEDFLSSYNKLLKSVFIDIPELEAPKLSSDNDQKLKYIVVSQSNKFVRRIFSRSSFECGGRFYGGWWQNCPKEIRGKIFINDWTTAEVDFSGLHIVILYALEKIEYWKEIAVDPYTVTKPDFIRDNLDCRKAVKSLALVSLNSSNEKSAFGAFRQDAPAGHYFKNLTNEQLGILLSLFASLHPKIAKYLNADMGIKLMNWDGKIAQMVMSHFLNEEIPVLCIHDSFIIPTGYEQELIEEMAYAFEMVLDVPFDAKLTAALREEQARLSELYLELSTQWVPYQSEMENQLKMQAKYVERASPNRSRRYLKQLETFKLWSGAEEYDKSKDQYTVGRITYPGDTDTS